MSQKETQKNNPNWPHVPDLLQRILVIRGSGSWKTNSLFNLINHQPDIDEIYLYTKDPDKAKDQFLIKIVKILEQSILIILKLLLNTPMIWMIFIKVLKNTIQIKNVKY